MSHPMVGLWMVLAAIEVAVQAMSFLDYVVIGLLVWLVGGVVFAVLLGLGIGEADTKAPRWLTAPDDASKISDFEGEVERTRHPLG